jgi:hypothetical protein
VHDRTDLLPSIVKPLAYGLSGSNFICVMQFLYDPRVPPLALALLIASMPPLLAIGAVFAMFERPIPHAAPIANAKLIAILTFALFVLCSGAGYAKLLSVVKFEFLVALFVGMIATLIILFIINHVLKKGH